MSVNFKINAKPLALVIGRAARVTERRNRIPILGMVRLIAEGSELKVSGTDLDVQIDATAPAEVLAATRFAVSPRPLLSLLRQLGDEVVSVSFDGFAVLFQWSDGRAAFTTLAAEDFPELQPKGECETVVVPPTLVSEALDPVRHCVSTEETRYYLNGICLYNGPDGALFVATDGHRLAARPAPALTRLVNGRDGSAILPRCFIGAFADYARGATGRLSLYKLHVEFETDNLRLVSKLIDGTYPDWPRIIPKDAEATIRVSRAALSMALARVAFVRNGEGQAATLAMSAGVLRLSAQGYDGMCVETAVGAAEGSFEGRTGFNRRYLAEAMRSVRGDIVTLAAPGVTGPFLLSGSDDAPGALNVLMPLRVGDRDFVIPEPRPAKKAA